MGGETALPFMHLESEVVNPPVVAIEILDKKPEDWSPLLIEYWKDVIDDPAKWAKAAESKGADLIVLYLSTTDASGNPATPEKAVSVVKSVLGATGIPLIVFGPGQAEIDNELLVPISEATKEKE